MKSSILTLRQPAPFKGGAGRRLATARAFDTSATLNPILTIVANQFMRDESGFVADEIFPPFPAALQAGNYYIFTPAELANVPTINPRAPGSAYPRLKQTLSNDNYACKDWGIEGTVPDEDRAKYSAYFDADLSTTRRIIDTIRINRELRVYTAVQAASSAAVAVHWNDGSSNPKADVDAAREQVRLQSGLLPNLLTITQPILNALSIHPRLLDVFKFTAPGVLAEDRLAAYFQIARVKVARSVIATNNEGQTFTPADIWQNNAFLCFTNPAADLQVPTYGRTFYWTAFTSTITPSTGGSGPGMTAGGGGPDLMQISSYRDETVKSDIHRSEHYVAEKAVCPLAGYGLTGILG